MLFERSKDEKTKKFYACSACRDRKICDFYMDFQQLNSQKNDKFKLKIYKDQLKRINQDFSYERLVQVVKYPENQLRFCIDCDLLVLKNQDHRNHKVMNNLTKDSLKRPSLLLKTLLSNNSEAQYFFTDSCVQFIVNLINDRKYKHVICIGTPRLHEYIQNENFKIQSILLDIDYRYKQFYPNYQFFHYNMFNNHFFDGQTAHNQFVKFISTNEKFVVLIDPPFGGLIQPLAYSIKEITSIWKKHHNSTNELVPLMLFYPYFNEHHIMTHLPTVNMSDYIVNYENHNKFAQNTRKYGSPIRLFTNIPLAKIILPKSDGYHYCNKCQRFISKLNKHCKKCNSCTSKDGREYNHCDICNRCFKSSWTHCNECNRCELAESCHKRSIESNSNIYKRKKLNK